MDVPAAVGKMGDYTPSYIHIPRHWNTVYDGCSNVYNILLIELHLFNYSNQLKRYNLIQQKHNHLSIILH